MYCIFLYPQDLHKSRVHHTSLLPLLPLMKILMTGAGAAGAAGAGSPSPILSETLVISLIGFLLQFKAPSILYDIFVYISS